MSKDTRSVFHGPFWTEALRQELAQAGSNGQIGTRLINQTDRLRIWMTEIAPGERLPFHTHVLDYVWTATSTGRARSRFGDGAVADMDYRLGTTRHVTFSPGQSMTHDLENIGASPIGFTTVEFLESANRPLFL